MHDAANIRPILAVIILTKNEELNLPACLESLRGLPADIFVVDSESTDQTIAIAQEFGCNVLVHPFINHAHQFNWALDNIDTNASWILRLDADERLTSELKSEIAKRLPGLDEKITGIVMKRRFYFLGRWIRHGGMYSILHMRIFRRGMGYCENRWMDEHIQVSGGEVIRFVHDFIDNNANALAFWVQKHNSYALREILDMTSGSPKGDGALGPVKIKEQTKKTLYMKLPAYVRAFVYWFVRFFILLGFLDGEEGLIFHFLHAMWYRFLIDANLYEYKQASSDHKQWHGRL